MTAKPPKWTPGEVLDVEWLCASPGEVSATEREELAREWASHSLAGVPRTELFRSWRRRRRAAGAGLPGAALDRIFHAGRMLAWTFGGLAGGLSAGGYLLYVGGEPVNPFWFVLWLVVVPLLFSLAVVAITRAAHDWSGPGALARWAVGAVCRRLPGEARTAWLAWSGTLAKHRERQAGLAVWPLLGITQRAACGFALGALVMLGLRVVFTDVVFGWQSSAGWPMERWHAVVQVIAAPWTWLFPDACPTLEQIRGSHFTFARGVATIEAEASEAWWPFLAGCLLVWGAGVRAVFILLIGWKSRAALRAPQFLHSDANAAHRALIGPLFASEAARGHAPLDEAPSGSARHAPGRAWLVLGEDVGQAAAAQAAVAGALGGSVGAWQAVVIDDPSANAAMLGAVQNASEPVAVLLRGARDPIIAIKKTLAQIAAAAQGRECVLLLQGDAARLALWKKFAAAHRLELEILPVP